MQGLLLRGAGHSRLWLASLEPAFVVKPKFERYEATLGPARPGSLAEVRELSPCSGTDTVISCL